MISFAAYNRFDTFTNNSILCQLMLIIIIIIILIIIIIMIMIDL